MDNYGTHKTKLVRETKVWRRKSRRRHSPSLNSGY
jgi:hypothetical protein